MLCGSGGYKDAPILFIWGHSQYCLQNGVQRNALQDSYKVRFLSHHHKGRLKQLIVPIKKLCYIIKVKCKSLLAYHWSIALYFMPVMILELGTI